MRGRTVVMLILGVVAVAVGALAGRGTLRAPSHPGPEVTPVTASFVETVAVHVSGLVVAPGVVHLAADSIVADAIDAAGGLLPGARVDQINLAAPVADGDQIVVPGPGEGGEAGPEAGDGPLSLNRATATELETLPGVGPVLAERIVAFREANGRFEVVEDLLEVSGIGEAKLAAIRDLVKP
ncbi:MAG: helix-hairpin-helix domain-containing protein [Acidimicrobiia bacterium]